MAASDVDFNNGLDFNNLSLKRLEKTMPSGETEFSLAEEQKLGEVARRAIVKPETLPLYSELSKPEIILRLLEDHSNLRSRLEIQEVIAQGRQRELNLLSANNHEARNPRHKVNFVAPYHCQTCNWQAQTED
jgi:hypothetical protein